MEVSATASESSLDWHERIETLAHTVLTHLSRLLGAVEVVPSRLIKGNDREHRTDDGLHALCKPYANTVECRTCRQQHAAMLRSAPAPTAHGCPHGNWCGLVPLINDGRAALAMECVLPASEEALALQRMRLMTLLVGEVLGPEAKLVLLLYSDGDHEDTPWKRPGAQPHPQVWNVMRHVYEQLPNAQMSAAGVAQALGVNATYLAHLFSVQTGMRMRHYIVSRRVNLAKVFLAVPGLQIKQIAFETGHVNSDWFSHVFHLETGLTPSAYREAHLRDS